jgi:hypothetical protein
LVKVKAHQKADPDPNKFCVSANEIADKVAGITRNIPQLWQDASPHECHNIDIPPFSNNYSFMIKGKVIDKGAARTFKSGFNHELVERMKLRKKQGLLFRLLPECGTKLEQMRIKSSISA